MSGSAPATPPLRHPPRGSLQRAAMRFGLLVLLLGGAVVAVRFTPLGDLLSAERLQALFSRLRGVWWAPLAHVAICALVGTIGLPATPLLIVGAAIFGAYWGALWNWAGITLASVAGYFLARQLGREFVERIGGNRMKRIEKLLHRRGFLPLVAVRFLPLPFPLVNAAAAVAGVRFPKFFLASALGMAPPIAILTYFSAALLEAATGERAGIARQLAAVSGSALLLIFLPLGIRRWQRRRRFRELRALRAARVGNRPLP